tara:strand:+ start:270 stop:566 length:297 start_codon:yes stop_codon:yes gene_type:complete
MTIATDRILKYKENNPTASLRSIGKAVETSHEYVRLVLKQHDISTKYVRDERVYCAIDECNNVLSTYQKRHTKMCTICRRRLLRIQKAQRDFIFSDGK